MACGFEFHQWRDVKGSVFVSVDLSVLCWANAGIDSSIFGGTLVHA